MNHMQPTKKPTHDAAAFPANFLWGAAASSYQIEGGSAPELRGESVWDAFCTRPGAVLSGHNGAVACDHYSRADDDIAMMSRLRLQAYRFSISWPRVLPEGTGRVNAIGLDFYDRLVDSLLARGMQPWATLFHWDYPIDLFRKGGWLNRDSAEWFGEYTAHIVDRLSDRVTHWMTLNEPQVFVQLGHADGTHAPGLKLPLREQLIVAHNALRAHGSAVLAIRAHAKRPALVGWAPVGHISFPISDSAQDIEAARTATFAIEKPTLWSNTWFADPVCLGHYPEDGLRVFADHLPQFPASDLAHIHQPLDFYGVNIYSGTPVRWHEGVAATVGPEAGAPRTALNWTVEPAALRWGPRMLAERYKLPVYITENGMSSHDWVDLDGQIIDGQRIDYTRRYLLALREAIRDGADIRGYFHWSIMDNFEWAEGYKDRFGLVHVDFNTLKRTPKASAHWYSNVIATNGRSLADPVTVQFKSGDKTSDKMSEKPTESAAHEPHLHMRENKPVRTA
jgi:beta-glucosidase